MEITVKEIMDIVTKNLEIYNSEGDTLEEEFKLFEKKSNQVSEKQIKILTEPIMEMELWWECKYCGENEKPECYQCVREDGKLVTDEL